MGVVMDKRGCGGGLARAVDTVTMGQVPRHQGAMMGKAMRILAVVGVLAAAYVAYRYGVR